ncbi:MAG: signal peptidase I [Lewinellaceae bacterium]|nr:signal peptidase I [Lewinellaceae bacterium]
MSILIFLIVSYILLSFSLSKLFPKAGVPSVKGWIPGVNFIEWAKIIGKSPKSVLWLLFPIVNIFVFCSMAIDLVQSFGKYKFLHSAAAVVYAPAIFYKIAVTPEDKYVGPAITRHREIQQAIEEARKNNDSYKLKQLEAQNPFKRSTGREWVESLVFAVFAAAFIRMFLIEAYMIPTPSMEGTLNVGDFLFVSKAHYGIRTPMTVILVPLLHNVIPIINKESYLKKPSLPYYRFPALEKVEAGKPFVFNWPVGDSVYITSSRSYFLKQVEGIDVTQINDRELASKIKNKDYVVRPVDKKDHYIKRCVASPGDSLKIIDAQLYINGVPAKNPEHMQFKYQVTIPSGVTLNKKKLDDWGIDEGDVSYESSQMPAGMMMLFLDQSQVKKLLSIDPGIKVDRVPNFPSPSMMFPFDASINKDWTVDDYGPIWIPKQGVTIKLDKSSLPFYRRIINVYEGNNLEVKGDDIYINGEKTDSYTFKQDYFWAMGDNRHNSEDSRSWGYVPMDHIVGKPLFIFFSTKEGSIRKGINWDRIFTSANK